MDMKAIRALAEIMKANDLTQVEITEEGKTIRMKREIAAVPVPAQPPFAPVMPAPAAVPVSEVFHDVLCIIEAMKTMNEITADCDGQILQIYAGNGQLVEVGQRLFLVGEAQ